MPSPVRRKGYRRTAGGLSLNLKCSLGDGDRLARFRYSMLLLLTIASTLPFLRRQAVEVLGRAADLALAHQFDQVRFGQLGDVVVGVAEGDLQLAAEIAGGEDAAAVDPEDFEDRDAEGMGSGSRQPLPVDRDRTTLAWPPIFVFRCKSPV